MQHFGSPRVTKTFPPRYLKVGRQYSFAAAARKFRHRNLVRPGLPARILARTFRLFSLAFALAAIPFAHAAAAAECIAPFSWVQPGKGPIAVRELLQEVVARDVVLLGETHDNAEHHRWQLQTLIELHALRPAMVIVLEMFPRRVQPVLDRWVKGELREDEFLRLTDWAEVWTFDARMYLPIFQFARMNRIPLHAGNVDRALVRSAGERGWDALDPDKREGLTRPAAADPAYRDKLRKIFGEHYRGEGGRGDLEHFVASQLVWDAALAQAIAGARQAAPKALVAALMGNGHLMDGFGVPHQLRSLGIREVASLMPWEPGLPCSILKPGVAYAVYGSSAEKGAAAASAAPRARLGVMLEADPQGVRIRSVEKNSTAEAAGMRAGDVLTEIAGKPARKPADVVEAVQRQAPGTWLPLSVLRDGATVPLLAKFPPAAPDVP
ncbi:MAG: ChaN family lipoprotein [Rhodocyclaceae bacterium]|nr:ChaN family lipoprotein [Rhodocyclaceae bacterium]